MKIQIYDEDSQLDKCDVLIAKEGSMLSIPIERIPDIGATKVITVRRNENLPMRSAIIIAGIIGASNSPGPYEVLCSDEKTLNEICGLEYRLSDGRTIKCVQGIPMGSTYTPSSYNPSESMPFIPAPQTYQPPVLNPFATTSQVPTHEPEPPMSLTQAYESQPEIIPEPEPENTNPAEDALSYAPSPMSVFTDEEQTAYERMTGGSAAYERLEDEPGNHYSGFSDQSGSTQTYEKIDDTYEPIGDTQSYYQEESITEEAPASESIEDLIAANNVFENPGAQDETQYKRVAIEDPDEDIPLTQNTMSQNPLTNNFKDATAPTENPIMNMFNKFGSTVTSETSMGKTNVSMLLKKKGVPAAQIPFCADVICAGINNDDQTIMSNVMNRLITTNMEKYMAPEQTANIIMANMPEIRSIINAQ